MVCDRLNCPKCEANFGQEVRFLKHLTDVHGVSDHLSLFLKLHCSDKHPTCQCSPECDLKLPWAGWKKGFTSRYARGHNARVYTSFSDPGAIKRGVEKRIEGFKTGRNKVWNKGLTTLTSEVLARAALKKSKTLRDGYANGTYVPWQIVDPERAKRAALKVGTANRLPFDVVASRVLERAPGFELLSGENDYIKCQKIRLRVKCKVCEAESEKSLVMLENSPVCYVCHPLQSFHELELIDFVRSCVDDEVIVGSRKVISPKELDVYVPSKLFAVEFNGLAFHGDDKVDPDYHAWKTRECAKLNITLMHVFSDEWRDKRSIVRSMIRSRLGKIQRTIGARKCKIVVLAAKQRRRFFEENHIDGDVRSAIAWGLVTHEGELVAALSLRTLSSSGRRKYPGFIEVARSATVTNTSVPGALGRLTKQARAWAKENEHQGLLSYVDLRYGTGKSYETVGYEEVGTTVPRFWWTDKSSRFDRFQYRADKKKGMSERQVAEEAGVVRVYGCPNRVMVLHVDEADRAS